MVKKRSIVKQKKRTALSGRKEDTHLIPRGYDVDTIVIMPVNRDTGFVYWEVTDRLLAGSRRKLKSGSARLMVKVSEADCLEEVCSFEADGQIGHSYIHCRPLLKPLIAEIGVLNGNGFVGLVRSETVLSSSQHHFTDCSAAGHETWMLKTGDTCEETRVPVSSGFVMSNKIIRYYRDAAGENREIFSAEFHIRPGTKLHSSG